MLTDKVALRRTFLEQRHLMSLEDRLAANQSVLQQLMDLKELQLAHKVFLYLSFGDEVDTHKLMATCISMGKSVYAPRIEKHRRMAFYPVSDLSTCRPNPWGILEPTGEDAVYPDKTSVIIVPMVGFDITCQRIGYGGGYYDTYLGLIDEAIPRIGIAYACQGIERLFQLEDYDHPLHKVVTEQMIYIRK